MSFTYENGQMLVGTSEGAESATSSVVLQDAKEALVTLYEDVILLTQKKSPLPGQVLC